MSSNETSNSQSSLVEQNNKEIEKFLIDPQSQHQVQQQQQQTVNILTSKQIVTNESQNQASLPYIIQNGNIYQLSTGSGQTSQINSSNLIQITGDGIRNNPAVKLTAIKNANILNLGQNKSRIIIKTSQSDSNQPLVSTLSPNSQKINLTSQFTQQNQNQIKTINLLQQNKQIIITNNQQQNKTNQIQTTTTTTPGQQQNGSPIIVLTPSNRTLNEQNLQFLIQQRQNNSNSVISNNSASNLNVVNSPSTVQQVKSTNMQQKIYIPSTGCVNLIKRAPLTSINETEANSKQNNVQYAIVANEVNGQASNTNLINLLNANKNQNEINKPKTTLEKELSDNSTNKQQMITNTMISSNLKPVQQIHQQVNVQHQNKNLLQPTTNNQKLVYSNKLQKETANITPIASSSNQGKSYQVNSSINLGQSSLNQPSPMSDIKPQIEKLQQQLQQQQSQQNEVLNESILNDCILPDTRIFASLLNKDHSLPPANSSNPNQKNDIKFKTVLIGNTEHVILDNLQNLSDFKGNFTDLKNLACSVADHLQKSVSIPAFLLIESKPTVDKIKSILNDIHINPIIIDTCASNSTQPQTNTNCQTDQQKSMQPLDPNPNREKFNQQHQNLIKKLSSQDPIEQTLPPPQSAVPSAPQTPQPQTINIVNPNNTPVTEKKTKSATPKRRVTKPKKSQIIVNSAGQTQVNKSKLTINDLIQQNAMNSSQELDKSNEPLAKKIKTINQLCNQPVQAQTVEIVQTQAPVQPANINSNPIQIQQAQPQNMDWLDQQIQFASEFIDSLATSVNDNQEQNTHQQEQQTQHQVQQQHQMSAATNEYNFDLDPFDTNLFFTTNLNDIEF